MSEMALVLALSAGVLVLFAWALGVFGGNVSNRQKVPGRDDVFEGTPRQITLPPGWKCDHKRWEWREVARDEIEHTVTEALWVYTWNEAAGTERWRAVQRPGDLGYSEGRTFPIGPGRQEYRTIPMPARSA